MTYKVEPRETLPENILQEIYNVQLLEYAMSCMRIEISCMLPSPPVNFGRDVSFTIERQLEMLNAQWMKCLMMLHDDVSTPRERQLVEGHVAFASLRPWLETSFDEIVKTKKPDVIDHKDYVAMLRYGGHSNNWNNIDAGDEYFFFLSEEAMQKFLKYLGYKYPNWKESNMSLIERVKTEREDALRAKDYTKRSVLGQLFDKAEKEAKKSNRDVTDDDIVSAAKKIIEGLGETRKFLIDAKAPREDERHQALNTEEAILTPYVPKQMSEEELLTAVTAAKIEKNKGKVMAFFKANFLNQYDGATAAKAADAYIKIAAAPEPKTET